MPRGPRMYSNSSVYHVMIRGNEKKALFYDNKDREKFISILQQKKVKDAYLLYAYCLMSNHVHLVIKEDQEIISDSMKKINTSYARYFNKKYDRIGHVFQDRYRSEVIEDDRYLLAVIRYIHNNPIKANIVQSPEQFLWSSYNQYVTLDSHLVEVKEILEMFSCQMDTAVQCFVDFAAQEEKNDFFLAINANNQDVKIKKYISRYLQLYNLNQQSLILKENRQIRDELIRALISDYHLSIRKIAELLSLTRGIVQKVKR